MLFVSAYSVLIVVEKSSLLEMMIRLVNQLQRNDGILRVMYHRSDRPYRCDVIVAVSIPHLCERYAATDDDVVVSIQHCLEMRRSNTLR